MPSVFAECNILLYVPVAWKTTVKTSSQFSKVVEGLQVPFVWELSWLLITLSFMVLLWCLFATKCFSVGTRAWRTSVRLYYVLCYLHLCQVVGRFVYTLCIHIMLGACSQVHCQMGKLSLCVSLFCPRFHLWKVRAYIYVQKFTWCDSDL